MADGADQNIEAFIAKWSASGGAERANYQLFLSQLAALIGAPEVEASVPSEEKNEYVFEKTVRFKHIDGSESSGFIDLYKKGCFVCEAKQSVKEGKRKADDAQAALFGEEESGRSKTGTARIGTLGWDLAMERARRQAESYAKALPKEHGWPPFLVIADVGHCIELYADFSGQGKNYAQFPDRRSFRIMLDDLKREDVRARLRLVWIDPHALDPAKRSAEVTRDIAERLAHVAKDLEKAHEPQQVALFLMRCLFTMFAEDVELLPKKSFYTLLEQYKGRAHLLQHALTDLWKQMDAGGFHSGIADKVRQFNGGLFRDAVALPTTEAMLGELLVAARRDWKDVEPAIFGTLLERALKPAERAQLGAHYTPRAYVERLVVPTIMEPLQEDWAAARVEAQQALEAGDRDEARKVVRRFHGELCKTRVLDPACGTGNFLYVAMEMMKRLEGEVLEFAATLGDTGLLELDRVTVDPHNFLGIELNPRAKEIAELVIWIGFIKWQIRTGGQDVIRDPVLRDFKTIEARDAILAWDRQELLRDEAGRPITKWDGRTTKLHPITGEEIPDEEARLELYKYVNPRIAAWPEAEFIVGNPPFIGGKDLRAELGDGYAEALWASRAKRPVPKAADLVMYWWDHAAAMLTRANTPVRRFGFVTTNSITQTFSRRVIQHYLNVERPLTLAFAIPDHPWVKGEDRANVRIAMTVAHTAGGFGILKEIVSEQELDTDAPKVELRANFGKIHADLSIGAEHSSAVTLRANSGVGLRGVCLIGLGFQIPLAAAERLRNALSKDQRNVLRPYAGAASILRNQIQHHVIDFIGLSENEARARHPELYERVLQHVKPERETQTRPSYRDCWWIFAEPRKEWRTASASLRRFIATVMTAKHRMFSFIDTDALPDQALVPIALDGGEHLAILSSRLHSKWATEVGGTLEDRPRYNKTRCFDTFPFPEFTPPRGIPLPHSAKSSTPSASSAKSSTRRSRSPKCTTCSKSFAAALN